MAKSQLQQLVMVEEDQEGVAEATLFTNTNASFSVINPQIEYDIPIFERDIKRASLTPLQGLSGTQTGIIRFSLELTGSDTGISVLPEFDLPLRACGFRQEGLIKLDLTDSDFGGGGGPFLHGETVTGGSSGATGTVVSEQHYEETEVYASDTGTKRKVLWVARNNGLGNPIAQATWTASETVTGTDSNTTAVLESGTPAYANTAKGWWPQSFGQSSFTASSAFSDVPDVGDFIANHATAPTAYGIVTGVDVDAANDVCYYRRVSGHFVSGESIFNVTQDPDGVAPWTVTVEPTIGADAAQFQIPTVSIGLCLDGVRQSLSGARGTVSVSGNIGEPVLLNFEFRGKYEAPVDGPNLSGVTYDIAVPPVLLGTSVRFGGTGDDYDDEYAPCVAAFTVDMNNTIEFRKCMNNSTGLLEAQIVSRAPSGTIDPELAPEALFDFIARYVGNTAGTRLGIEIGSAAGNTFRLDMPGVAFTAAPIGDRDGITTRQLSFGLHGGSQTGGSTAADNEFSIIWQTG